MNNIFSEIRSNYKAGNSFTKLLYINLSFFIIYTLIWVPYHEIEKTINYLAFPSKTEILIHKPWTFLSYMFIHTDPLHILSNMVFLYFGSKLFLQHFNNKQLRDMLKEVVEEVLQENGILAESTQKSNEVFSFKVGKHIFECKVTKIKKIS